ncbi:MAG TPA: hypothetical protein VNQ77_04210 [Frankiaceae bacterium]|nr:hypothetical protein [Frankiaceae bacterium]
MADRLHIEFADERRLVVTASGLLDRDLARVLLRVVAIAVAQRVPRIRVDLGGVRTCTADAAVAVTGCRRLAQLMPDRVSVTGDV